MGRMTLKMQSDENQQKREREIKLQACWAIKRIAFRYGMNQRELAFYLGTAESCVSRMMKEKVEAVSYEQLFRFITRLAPNFKFLISV